MSLDLNTRIVTATPYNIVDADTVVFVNVSGAASVVLPATGDIVSNILQQANQNPQSLLQLSSGERINSGLDDPAGLNPESIQPSCITYQSYYIKDFSGRALTNPITVTSAGGKTIDGFSFALINTPYGHIQVVYDGTNWKIIA